MTGWRKVAEQLRQGHEGWDNRDDRDNRPGLVPRHDPIATVKEWRASLASVDINRSPHGLDAKRSRKILQDARWLLIHFGQKAACDGWSVCDLFGLLPGRDAWGGIADRLRASRSLMMTADVAKWRRVINGEPESLARGLGDTVQMVPLWVQD